MCMEKLGLYLSVPFCRSKCTYCNFASGVFPAAYHDRYVARLEQDLNAIHARALRWEASLPNTVDSIYFGGGTPTLLAPALIRRLFVTIRREFAVMPTAEITVECAPGQLDSEVLDALVECGVNRISFGVQSFIDSEARATGRLHTRVIALEDIRRARAAGIARISADLIAGLPGQTPDSWQESLSVLVDCGVDHASVYMLEVDEDSRLGRELLASGGRYHAREVPSDDQIAGLYSDAIAFLAGHSLAQYEISNFARVGHESLHNLKYWRRQPYVGVGVDAHSMLRSLPGRSADPFGNTLRFAATDELEAFMSGPGWPVSSPHRLRRQEEFEEAWFLGLRLNEGVSLEALRREFPGGVVRQAEEIVRELERQGLLSFRDKDHVVLTSDGRLLSNNVFTRFLAEPEAA